MHKKGSWNRKFKKEIPAIIGSLLLAILLWYFNQLRFTEERSFQLEPQLQISDQMIPIRTPRAVTVTVRGDGEQLQNIDPDDFSVVVDFSNKVVEGEYEGKIVVVRSGVARHLKGIEVSHSPLLVNVALERKISRPVKVRVNTRGAVKAGYEMDIGVPAPDEVLVSGARSEMERLEYLETEVVDLSQLTQSVEDGQKSVTLDKSVRLLPLQEGTSSLVYNKNIEILYTIRLRELIKQITIKDLYINQIDPNDRFIYKLETEYARLNLSGSELVLNRLNINGFILGVELGAIKAPGEYTLPVIRMFNSSVTEQMTQVIDLGLNPAEIRVVVEEK